MLSKFMDDGFTGVDWTIVKIKRELFALIAFNTECVSKLMGYFFFCHFLHLYCLK